MTTTTIPERGELITREAQSWPDRAREVRILDDRSNEAAAQLMLGIKALRKEAEAVFGPVVAAAHAAHKAAKAAELKVTEPLNLAELVLKNELARYKLEQDRVRREEEERRRQEAQRLAEDEARRAAAEAQRVRDEEATRLAALAIEQEQAGDAEAAVATLAAAAATETAGKAEAQAILARPVVAPPVLMAPAQKLAGVSFATRWVPVVEDLRALCRAIGEGRLPTSYVEPNMTALRQLATAQRGEMNVPGVRATPVTDTRGGGR